MKFKKQVFITKEGHEQYKIFYDNRHIAIVDGFDKYTNKKHATLFEYAPQMKYILVDNHTAFKKIYELLNDYGGLPVEISNKIDEIIEESHKNSNDLFLNLLGE